MFDLVDRNLFYKNWVRPMKEIEGYKWLSNATLTINALGIDSKDLKIDIDGRYLCVSGKTKVEKYDLDYSINYKFILPESLITNIESIDYEVKDGIIYIDFNTKKKKETKIKITNKSE